MLELKNYRSGRKTLFSKFCYFNSERNYDVLNWKSPWVLLKKNINFNNNSFRHMKLVLQLISHERKQIAFFVPFILSEGNVFNICVLSQCIVYWIHFQNIHTFTYQNALLHTLLLLVFRIFRRSVYL